MQTPQIIFLVFIIFSEYPYEHFDTNILKIGQKLSSQEFLGPSELTENLKNTIKYRNINFVIEVSTRAHFKDNIILIKILKLNIPLKLPVSCLGEGVIISWAIYDPPSITTKRAILEVYVIFNH